MNIEVKLKDDLYCEGCPCLQASYFGGSPDCGLGFDIIDNPKKPRVMDETDIRPPECHEKCGT